MWPRVTHSIPPSTEGGNQPRSTIAATTIRAHSCQFVVRLRSKKLWSSLVDAFAAGHDKCCRGCHFYLWIFIVFIVAATRVGPPRGGGPYLARRFLCQKERRWLVRP